MYKQLKWTLPLLTLIILAPFSPWIDPYISNLFYSESLGGFSTAFYHKWIYHYAVIPALLAGTTSAILFLASFFIQKLEKMRFPSFFLAMSMAIGAGLITHLLFKEFWFRPRPCQTLLFGGVQPFLPFYLGKITFPNLCKSFPSGHATMGFYFINFILLGKRLKNPLLIRLGISLTFIMSLLLCYSRIAQGAHFISDTFMSLVVTWYAALVTEKLTFDYLAKKEWTQLNLR